jgi:hypothetical protein
MIMISLKLVRLSLQIYTIGDRFEILLSGNVCILLIDFDFTWTCIFEKKSAMMTKNIHTKAAIADTDGGHARGSKPWRLMSLTSYLTIKNFSSSSTTQIGLT